MRDGSTRQIDVTQAPNAGFDDYQRHWQVSLVLNHDLRQDMRNAFLTLARFHGLIAADGPPAMSDVQIVTPMTMPG